MGANARRALLGALALGVAVAPTGGSTAIGKAGDPVERVTGKARNHFVEFGGPNRLRIRARGIGPDARGHVVGSGDVGNGNFHVEGRVTCIRVEKNLATVKYRYTERRGPGAPPPGGVQVYVADNGRPSGGEPVDANGTDAPMPRPLFGATADECDDPRLREGLNTVDSGDYRVRDAG